MNFFHATILGAVEGVTEFLPISSTGHLMLAARLLGLTQTNFVKSFEIAIQLGAILAVIVLYGKSLLIDFKIAKRVCAAFVPTAIIGFALYKFIKHFLLGDSHIVLWSLLLGGVFLIVFEKNHKENALATSDLKNISYHQAFLIGLFQALAVVPGVSRAAATIIGGLMLGIQRKTIVEFSFVLAVPTMLAATGYDLLKSAHHFSSGEWLSLAVGFFTAFLVSITAIKFLLRYIQNHNFVFFGVYRIAVALLFWRLI